MSRAPWPAVLLFGVAGGIVGGVGLCWLVASIGIDRAVNRR